MRVRAGGGQLGLAEKSAGLAASPGPHLKALGKPGALWSSGWRSATLPYLTLSRGSHELPLLLE